MKRSFERILFVIGMGIVFLGNFLPIVNSAAIGEATDEEYYDEDIEEENSEYSDDAATYSYDETSGEEATGTESETDAIESENSFESESVELADSTEDAIDDSEESSEAGLMNVFQAASYYNEAGTAQISSFIIITWLAALAGIITFLLVKNVAGDVVSWLVGACFGIAAIVAISAEQEISMFGWASVGFYIAIVGYIVALVGIIKNAIKTK